MAAVVLIVVSASRMADTASKIDRLDARVFSRLEEIEGRPSLQSTWKDASNVTHTVTTPRNENESDEAWATRHKNAVEALKAIYPPV